MKADPFAQLRLLDLQALDTTLDQLAHRRGHLPEMAEIARLEGLVAARRGDVVLAQTLVSDLQRELDKAEADIEQVRVRKARDEQRLASGAITQPKQLQELEHEVGTLAKRQSDLEDAELEVMERMEQAQSELDALLTEQAGHTDAIAEAAEARDAAWVEIDASLASTRAERDAVAAEIPADLLALYEKIRAAEGGTGVGAVARGACTACRLDLMQNEKAEYRAAPVDEVLRHECRRIIVRTAESGL
ncbi:MAG: zinc ribbon domain-containing protein [Mycobacteriales bacterium]